MSIRSLYLFNPEHDLALANGEANYMPPESARIMVSDLALLPMWYAEPGSAVLASSAYNLGFMKEIQTLFPLSVELLTESELVSERELRVLPWGWNPALRKRMSLLGVSEGVLPDLEKMAQLRFYSHRSQAVKLLPKLRLDEFFCGESWWMTASEEWRVFVERYEHSLLKAPLSGSGKGLNWCKGKFTPQIANWCARISKLQDGVVGEPIYNKVEDFAMEFYSDGMGCVRFAGYSLFHAGKSGVYEGNLLLSDEEILHRLLGYVPLDSLSVLRYRLEEELSEWIGTAYTGYLGVDMMICLFEEKPLYRIHPCVEINLRMNMGVFARLFADKHLVPEAKGIYKLAFHAIQGEALVEHQRLSEVFPLRTEEGRIRSGYLSLVPVTTRSKYRAFVICE